MLLLRPTVDSRLRKCCRCKEIWSKRKSVFEDDVFIENTRLVSGSKTQDLNLRAPT